jgi:FAD/FMN-containing dehydrogenase
MIRFAGATEAVAFQIEQARALLKHELGIKHINASFDDEPLWHALAALPMNAGEQLRMKESEQMSWRVHVAPEKLSAMLVAEDGEHAARFPSESYWHAGAGDGRLRVMSALPPTLKAGVELLTQWRTLAQRAGGWMIVESAPREIKEAFDAWGDAGASAIVMRRIKQQLDPSNTFSPGRFEFGSESAAES